MPTLIDRRGRREDFWADPGDGGRVAPAGAASNGYRHLLLPLAEWLEQREALLAELEAQGGPTVARLRLGVELGTADDPAQIADELASLSLVAIRFPRFTDGRGYSIARELRDIHRWRGELRATGDILRDQLFYLARCGFDTFALRDDQNVDGALGAFRTFSEAYQAAFDRGPLFGRRHAHETQHAGS